MTDKEKVLLQTVNNLTNLLTVELKELEQLIAQKDKEIADKDKKIEELLKELTELKS